MRILIIDDNDTVREAVKRLVEAAGHTVTEAYDGKDGVWACLANRPDYTITDMSMNWMDGDKMIVEIRKVWPEAKFIAMSATASWALPDDVPLIIKPDIQKILEHLK